MKIKDYIEVPFISEIPAKFRGKRMSWETVQRLVPPTTKISTGITSTGMAIRELLEKLPFQGKAKFLVELNGSITIKFSNQLHMKYFQSIFRK